MFMWILGKFKIFHSWMRPNRANTNKKILPIPKWNWDTSRRNVFITMGIKYKYIFWNINSNSSLSSLKVLSQLIWKWFSTAKMYSISDFNMSFSLTFQVRMNQIGIQNRTYGFRRLLQIKNLHRPISKCSWM